MGELTSDAVWDEVVEALQSAWPNETLHWNESPRIEKEGQQEAANREAAKRIRRMVKRLVKKGSN